MPEQVGWEVAHMPIDGNFTILPDGCSKHNFLALPDIQVSAFNGEGIFNSLHLPINYCELREEVHPVD